MDDRKKPQIRPFLQEALNKDPLDRTFLEKLAVGIYGPGIEAQEDRDKPAAVLDETYQNFVLDLPPEVQADVDRYLHIFKNNAKKKRSNVTGGGGACFRVHFSP